MYHQTSQRLILAFPLAIPASTTEAFAVKDGVYDLEIEDGGGIVTRILLGKVKISLEVTVSP